MQVLRDTHFANMTMDKWKPVTDTKVTGLINLDKVHLLNLNSFVYINEQHSLYLFSFLRLHTKRTEPS